MKNKISLIVVFIIIISIGMTVYALEPVPNLYYSNYEYHTVLKNLDNNKLYFYNSQSKPYTSYQGETISLTFMPFSNVEHWYEHNGIWYYGGQSNSTLYQVNKDYAVNFVLWSTNYGDIQKKISFMNLVDYVLGTGTTSDNPTIFDYFAGINFDYDGFLGKVGIKLEAKKDGHESYVPVQEWEYPAGEGSVNIDSHDIAYYDNASYKLTIYDGDEVINNCYYIVNTTNEKQPYIDIIYPSNGFQYEYFPNINIEYFDMGDLRIYINEVLYKRISTTGKEGIEVVPGTHSLFQIGLNTIYVEDSNNQTVATVQYMVMREGEDPTIIDEPEFDSDSWVRELYQRIMSEYSQFFIYLKNIYSFLPYEILGLVVIVIMLSVVLWFTGRK